jgi:hypothetical protein
MAAGFEGAPGSGVASPAPRSALGRAAAVARDAGVTKATARAAARAQHLTGVGAQRLNGLLEEHGVLAERDRLAEAVGERFRLPAAEDPAPRARWLVGVCAWAAALGLGGMAVALRALVGLMTVGASWYGPTVVTIGLTGLLCTVGAFASVHRRRMPWIMLGIASVALLIDWIITGAVT